MDLIKVFRDTYQKTLNKPVNARKFKFVEYSNDIEVLNINCIDAVINVRQKYPKHKIGLLNFADGEVRGGCVTRGAKSQEEDICRTTNLYHTLLEVEYPIKSDEIIVSKDIKLIKNSKYELIDDEITIDYVITKDALVANWHFTPTMYQETEKRIEMILKTADSLKINVLILGAFGCGVFRNPPESIASIFHKYLKKYKFKKVIFAILEKKTNTLNNTFKTKLCLI